MTSPFTPTYSPSGRSRVAPGVSTVDLLDLSIAALASSVAASQPIRKLAEQPDDDGGDDYENGTLSADVPSSPSSAAATAAGGDGERLQKDGSQKNVRTKLDGTVVTDADGAAQRIIVAAIRHISKDVRIVGEEERKEMESSQSREFEEAARRFLEMEANGAEHDDDGASSHTNAATDEGEGAAAAVEHEIAGIFEMVREEITSRYSQSVARHVVFPDIAQEGSKFKGRMLRYQHRSSTDDSDVDEAEHDAGDTGTAAESLQKPPLHRPSSYSEQQRSKTAMPPMLSPRDRIVDSSRVSVLIDPLDGTSCYASGKNEYVTTLVAVVLDNTPIFGVICKPFGHADEPCILNSGCFAVYGGFLLGGIYVAGGDEIERSRTHRAKTQRPSSLSIAEQYEIKDHEGVPNASRTAVISKSRAGGVVGRCIRALADEGLLHPDPVYISGAGVKALNLLVGSNGESLWFFPKSGTSLWDVAAADALLRVVGGRLSDKYGRDIDYSKSRQDAENNDGIVACNDSDLHRECVRIFQEADWKDED